MPISIVTFSISRRYNILDTKNMNPQQKWMMFGVLWHKIGREEWMVHDPSIMEHLMLWWGVQVETQDRWHFFWGSGIECSNEIYNLTEDKYHHFSCVHSFCRKLNVVVSCVQWGSRLLELFYLYSFHIRVLIHY